MIEGLDTNAAKTDRARAIGLGKVYPITGSRNSSRSPSELARIYLEAGIRFFQVREKRLTDRELCRELAAVRRLCDQVGARFLVNDRVDLALAGGADGVHLGQRDLHPESARKLLGPTAIIGLSTHNRTQLEEAHEAPIDYLALGPIFGTSTKEDAEQPLGLDGLRSLAPLSRLPLVAIGGITAEKARAVWFAGADAVAVVSDINDHPQPARRIAQYGSPTQEVTP